MGAKQRPGLNSFLISMVPNGTAVGGKDIYPADIIVKIEKLLIAATGREPSTNTAMPIQRFMVYSAAVLG
jgi:hypothetical protein